ncbi:unnamed protein product [Urochloa humidicola]
MRCTMKSMAQSQIGLFPSLLYVFLFSCSLLKPHPADPVEVTMRSRSGCQIANVRMVSWIRRILRSRQGTLTDHLLISTQNSFI